MLFYCRPLSVGQIRELPGVVLHEPVDQHAPRLVKPPDELDHVGVVVFHCVFCSIWSSVTDSLTIEPNVLRCLICLPYFVLWYIYVFRGHKSSTGWAPQTATPAWRGRGFCGRHGPAARATSQGQTNRDDDSGFRDRRTGQPAASPQLFFVSLLMPRRKG